MPRSEGRVLARKRRITRPVAAVAALALMAGPAIALASPAGSATETLHVQLHAVSCVNTTTCFAVGDVSGTTFDAATPLIEQWNGKAWTLAAVPTLPPATSGRLTGISCTGATNCFAVGTQFNTASTSTSVLVERWNGKAWSIVATPNPSASIHDRPALRNVSCTSATFCIAAGELVSADANNQYTGDRGILERWNGHVWSLVSTPTPRGSSSSSLYGVSCTSPSACFAVGNQGLNTRPPNTYYIGPVTLTERWDGKAWSVVASPTAAIGEGATLESVSCTGKTSCVAAGSYLEGGPGRPGLMTERWNGKAWSLLTNPVPSRAYTDLPGVSCTGTTNCITAGYAWHSWDGGLDSTAVTERWNGTTWSIVASRTAGARFSTLEAVSCVKATYCVAVGHSSPTLSGAYRALIEWWDGTKWSTLPSPTPPAPA